MNRAFFRSMLCRILIALTAWAPFHLANAAMVGTEQAVAATAQNDRARVLGRLEREDAVKQMRAFGIDPAQAKARVNAMSDQEVASVAQRMDALPAGGLHGAGAVIVLLVIIGVIWWAVTKAGTTR